MAASVCWVDDSRGIWRSGLNYVSYGLIGARSRRRLGFRSMMSVQSSLVISRSCSSAPSPAQEISAEAREGEWIGCFCLTEPNHGSDRARCRPGRKKSRAAIAQRHQDVDLQLPIADVFMVWARTTRAIYAVLFWKIIQEPLGAGHPRQGRLRASITARS